MSAIDGKAVGECRALAALVDGPKHEHQVCDRPLANLLAARGWITLTPAEPRGMQLAITDKGRAALEANA